MTPVTLIWLVTGCLMLQPLSTDLYLASLPSMATDFGVTPAAVQNTLSLFVIGFGSAQLVSGPLSDRYGRRPVLIGGLTLYLLSSIACALAPGLAWLVAARFAQAIGCCTGVVVARAIIRDAHSAADGARVLAKASSLLSLAAISGPVLGSYLQVAFGWRAAFVALALAGLTMWIATLLRLRESNSRPNPEAMRLGVLAGTYSAVIRTPAFWAYALPGALSYASIFVFISGTPFVLIRVLGVATEYYGYLFAFGVCGYLTGALLCRRLLGTIGIQRVLRLGTAIGLMGGLGFLLFAMAGVQHWLLVVIALFVVMTAHGINIPCTQAGSLAPFPEQAGAAAGLFGCVMMLVALGAGIWVGSSHDGTLLPLASISATVAVMLFASTRLLARHGKGA
ncbi:MAG: MFS transporter DHA1 family bicyclomycin/chloramphenicol resistance protein [Rhodocyclaceae bacterium]|nr:MAG: MFS transporter DHA1 family bicyclomycin/chloramphenicol resistance protein [Rhodocyclaceae bacterium]TNC99852.1 MAG: MFS transporter, DHA1 family, bicyclomycin/chloramphenicol resistance protein [Rhodocyclaceae bacterium]